MLNYETAIGLLTTEERARLMAFLPPEDTANATRTLAQSAQRAPASANSHRRTPCPRTARLCHPPARPLAEEVLERVFRSNEFLATAMADYPRFLADGVFDKTIMDMRRQRARTRRRDQWKVCGAVCVCVRAHALAPRSGVRVVVLEPLTRVHDRARFRGRVHVRTRTLRRTGARRRGLERRQALSVSWSATR